MLIPYTKRYVRFIRVEEVGRTLVYAILLENDGCKEIALCEPHLVRILIKTSAPLVLPAHTKRTPHISKPILSPFIKILFSTSEIPVSLYARPPTL